MHMKFISAAVVAATLILLPLCGQAQTYTDNAGNYSGNYAGKGGDTPGFGPFRVVLTTNAGGNAGTFEFSAKIAENNEGASGTTPSTMDTPATPTSKGPQSFGFYASGKSRAGGDPSVTITRAFNVPTRSTGLTPGDVFSLDFATGFNDGGTSGVALTNFNGTIGSFIYQAGSGFVFNGVPTGQNYKSGVLHLVYTLTSPTAYTLDATGVAVFSGKGTFATPITGFLIQQTNSAGDGPDHDGFFNNLVLKCVPKP